MSVLGPHFGKGSFWTSEYLHCGEFCLNSPRGYTLIVYPKFLRLVIL